MNYYNKFKGIIQTSAYCEQTALSLAVACDLSYEDDLKILSSTVESWNYTFKKFGQVVKNPDIDTQFFVMSNDENIVVVFRGSDSPRDWMANFKISYHPGPLDETKAHEGFQDSLFPAVVSLTNAITSIGLDNKKLWITGHSVGGALSSLYAGMLVENGYDVYGVYTFASPRPGDSAFENCLKDVISGPHYRVVNTGDVIPHVPPEPFFSHSGLRVILKEDVKEHSSDSWLSETTQALRLFAEQTLNRFDVGNNHSLSADDESYIPRLINDFNRSN
ncbi:MAG: lipase [Gammaproteobacteria bacterium]|nr:MAG: lipase [Gammaproteobacteria bacterium]